MQHDAPAVDDADNPSNDPLPVKLRVRLLRWLIAARPHTLPLALSPTLAGLALAWAANGLLVPWVALATLLAATVIQIATNLYNDAVDFERGTDTPERLGPPRASAQGWFPATQVKRAAHLCFALALLIGLLLVWRGGWPIVLLGIAAIGAGYAYTGGPRPIAYGPFGELFVLAFFGVAAVAGSHYLQVLAFDWHAPLTGLALGLPAAAVLLLNNLRDRDSDRRAGRHTLVAVISPRGARAFYAVLLLLPIAMLPFIGLPGQAWMVALALPVAVRLIVPLWRGADGTALNALLAQTALYQVLLVMLLIAGLLLPKG